MNVPMWRKDAFHAVFPWPPMHPTPLHSFVNGGPGFSDFGDGLPVIHGPRSESLSQRQISHSTLFNWNPGAYLRLSNRPLA